MHCFLFFFIYFFFFDANDGRISVITVGTNPLAARDYLERTHLLCPPEKLYQICISGVFCYLSAIISYWVKNQMQNFLT